MHAPEVFISYSSHDRTRVEPIADALESAGISVWIDRRKIPGGTSYGPEIVRGIRDCKFFALMCSDRSLRSRNVKQEIQLAWKYERPCLPLLLDRVSFPEQVEYWLEGCQWIEVLDHAPSRWLSPILQVLKSEGSTPPVESAPATGGSVPSASGSVPTASGSVPSASGSVPMTGTMTVRAATGLEGLRALARFTDQLWPIPAEKVIPPAAGKCRGLGAPQDHARHAHRLGSRVRLVMEVEREGHLLLLDEGPEKLLYCLCPSWFAPETRVHQGRLTLPQPGSRYDAFEISGAPGREHLLAILTDEPISFDWMPQDPRIPARVLDQSDVADLVDHLHRIEGNSWTALGTYFDILPA